MSKNMNILDRCLGSILVAPAAVVLRLKLRANYGYAFSASA
jgi:hypothetical protein